MIPTRVLYCALLPMLHPTVVLLAILAFSTRLVAAETLLLTSPRNYQVVQRHSSTSGSIAINGSIGEATTSPATLQVRLQGVSPEDTWQALTSLAPGQTQFHASLNAPAGGWYRLEVRLVASGTSLAQATVEHVGVGEVFVVTGQSNSANHGEEKQESRTGRVSAFSGTDWVLSKDPQPGASGGGGSFIPPFGDALAERFRVPIGIVAVGVGATSVREWLPRGVSFPHPPTLTGNVIAVGPDRWESKGLLFDRLMSRLAVLGHRGFRAVLWHQGESDANQRDASRTLPGELYQRQMEILMTGTAGSLGWAPPWFVAQVSYHTPDDPGSPDIRAAQKALWISGAALEGPDTDALTGELRDGGGKGVHFSGKGLREHASRWADKVGAWLDTQLSQPPSPAQAPGPRGGAPHSVSPVRPQ